MQKDPGILQASDVYAEHGPMYVPVHAWLAKGVRGPFASSEARRSVHH